MSLCYNTTGPLPRPSNQTVAQIYTGLYTTDVVTTLFCFILNIVLFVYYIKRRWGEKMSILYVHLILSDIMCCLNLNFLHKSMFLPFYLACMVSSRFFLSLLTVCRMSLTAFPARFARCERWQLQALCALGWLLGCARGVVLKLFDLKCAGPLTPEGQVKALIAIEVLELAVIMLTAGIQLTTVSLLLFYKNKLQKQMEKEMEEKEKEDTPLISITSDNLRCFNDGIVLLSLFFVSFVFWSSFNVFLVAENLLANIGRCGVIQDDETIICAADLSSKVYLFIGSKDNFLTLQHLIEVLLSTTSSILLFFQSSLRQEVMGYC